MPDGICNFGMTGGFERWTIIQLPQSVLDAPLEKQLIVVPEYMHAYRGKYNGQVPFFGRLTGFKLVRLLDYLQFDSHGIFVEHVEKPFRLGSCSVTISGRDVTNSFGA